jgi:GTP-binding protein
MKCWNVRDAPYISMIELKMNSTAKLSLEESLDFLEKDELLEITPKSLRLRKKYLTELERRRHGRNTN